MSNDPGAPGPPGEYQPGQQGWGAPQQPPHPGGFGQQQPQQPPPGWGGYPPPGQPGYGMPPGPAGPQGRSGNPLAVLGDFNFDTFITPSVVKILYIVGMVLAGLFYVGALIGGFAQGVGFGLLALVVGAVAVLLWIIMFRVVLEFYYAVVRMSEDIHRRG